MSKSILPYLKREHARLEQEIEQECRGKRPDQVAIARLKKLKLVLKDQIAQLEREREPIAA